MVVAEKSVAPANVARSPRQTLIVQGTLGALYLLAGLWLVFLGLPTLWQMLDVANLFTEKTNEFLASALLFLVALPVIFGLFVLGRFLEGPNPIPGLRAASVYLATCVIVSGLIATAGLELWAFVGLILLVCTVLLFYLHAGFLNWLVRCEEQGWLHAFTFKPNQGVRVRRLTVIAIMIVIICGIYTMMLHDMLRTGTWHIATPFSQSVVESKALEAELAAHQKKIKDNEITAAEAKEPLRGVHEKLDRAYKHGWSTATNPWMVTQPFGEASWVFMYQISLTIPVLILILSGWFAWRLVSWPVFADFLIATEAEMNKVSWTTRKRLYQDTVVVLVTVFLMTLFLFVVDIIWIWVLTNPVVDVLKHNPQEFRQKQQSGTQW